MPRKRKVGKARLGYNESDRQVLQFGVDFFGGATLDPKNRAACRSAWRELGAEIMAHWLDRLRARAGTRPWGWWVFELGLEARPPHREQLPYLQKHGLLTAAEQQLFTAAPDEDGPRAA